ncbi:MAG TPA: cob(I)yrinic acid a,c-diamide adenosyltransferase, partial [Actinobacteria bacterium]|nr:cob(I)yrinic acid a,c-diamide adenosyltransferase [Actinomycetota bacterium]
THAVKYGQVSLDSLVRTIDDKAPYLELVITGRYAPPELLDACDYVTEMREIKHPFRDGIRAREGTEY